MKLSFQRCFFILFLAILFLPLIGCASQAPLKPSNLPNIGNSPIFGDPKAPVKIVEFTDFECHFCGQIQPALRQTLQAHPTEVSLVFKNFPLTMHPHAHLAHLAAMCANEQNRFWPYRNLLFQNQNALNRQDLIDYATQLGLNVDSFAKCLDDEKYDSQIEQDFKEGLQSGVIGTPTFFINGKPFTGAQPFAAFEQAIHEALAERS